MSANTIAITGHGGLLGSTMLRVLGQRAVGVDADVRDADQLKHVLASMSDVTWVVHAAANTNVGACEKNPEEAFAVNAEGTKHAVEAARTAGVPMIYISTGSVFSGTAGNYRESDAPEPNNVYNRSKVMGEEYVRAYEKGIIVRNILVGIHPKGSRGKNFMEWLHDSLRDNKDIQAFDDVRMNMLSNWTTAAYIERIISKGIEKGIFHIATSDVLSKADIVEMVAKRFPAYRGTITRASVASIPDGVVRPREMWLNCDRTNSELGIAAPSIAEEIETIFSRAPLA